uniref:Uncharacterized protein n=1 Tax=Candidatus Kentrum sp. TUN TaxID=2126343 RepID=A0A450ZB37_9GAMM|nr:MAG: hypothetical protein BECKTUN1418D_GA0071000_100418 [Candidatus Kentron sp. TUN]
MLSISENKKGGFLPEAHDIAHTLCFVIHDAMVQIIKSGEEQNVFTTRISLKTDNEVESLEEMGDIFLWLEIEKRFDDRAKILKTYILPFVLSDMMHCVFESLESSRKAKLSISYMLIRKPLQESLYLLEEIVLDELDFSEKLATDPLKLRPSNASSIENHVQRIRKVLEIIGESTRFDANYIAQLRYEKRQEDSFDRICNKAMHLFTERRSIRTEKLNINFIFSGWDTKLAQWSYLYSRLPYLLFYIYKVVEYILGGIAPTTQKYLDDIQRRISALIILWWESVEERYKCHQLTDFAKETKFWLYEHCKSSRYRRPENKDLLRMYKTGAYPKGE